MTDDKTPEDSKIPESRADESGPDESAAGESATQRVIGAFGGIRPMATKLGAAVSTVQGWKERDAIPPGRHGEIREAAARHGVTLSEADLAASEGSEKEKVTAWVPRDEPAAAAPPDESGPDDSGPITIDMEPAGGAAPKAATPKPEEKSEAKPEGQRTKVPESGSRAQAEDRKAPSAAGKPAKPTKPSAQAPERQAPERQAPKRQAPESRAKVSWLVPFLAGAVVAVAGFGLAVLTVDLWRPGGGRADGGGADGAAVAGLQQGLDDLGKDLSGQAKAIEKLEADLAALPAPSAGPAPEIVGQLNDLGATAADLTRRLTALEQRPAGSGASSDQMEALSKVNEDLGTQLQALEGRLDSLGQPGPETAKLEDRFTGIEGRLADLDRLEKELMALTVVPAGSPASGQMALVLALIQLRDALGGPGPYGAQLDQFSQVAGDHAGLGALLAPLQARADSGVPTLAGLTGGFSQVVGAVVAAGAGKDADGVLSGVLQSLSDVVTVRPVGDIEGSGAGAVVARVEHRLRAGDLPAALGELDALDGAAAEAAAAWRRDAEARVAADAALAALGAALVTQLARSGG